MKTKKGKTLFKQQKLLLVLLQEFGERLSIQIFKNIYFIYKWEEKQSYEFVPYKYGCFSF